MHEIRDIADFLYERFLECKRKKLTDSRLEKSGNDTIEKEIFISFISYFLPELCLSNLNKNILTIKQRFSE